jgi:hypothetical protein
LFLKGRKGEKKRTIEILSMHKDTSFCNGFASFVRIKLKSLPWIHGPQLGPKSAFVLEKHPLRTKSRAPNIFFHTISGNEKLHVTKGGSSPSTQLY